MAFSSALFSHCPLHFHSKKPSPYPFLSNPTRKTLSISAISPQTIEAFDTTTIAVIGGSSVAAIAAALTLTDPEKRRQLQAEEVGGGDKEVVREYFNNNGFDRWKKIYGDTDEVNKVQLDIRIGHAKTVESVMKMLTDDGSLCGVTVCDAGCGTGCLSIPLAKEGAIVSASDISAAMVAEAEKQVVILSYVFLLC